MLLNSRKIFLPAYHLICQEDCALLNGFTVLLITLAKLVSIPPVKKLAETDFTMQHVITASLDKPQREVLPTDLSHLLSLGQQVIAIHPKTREVNNGKTFRFWWARGIRSKRQSGECNQPHKHVGKSNKVTLTGALQSGRSPQFSKKSYNNFECRKSTPVQSYDPM
ncbi:hypothetical protein V6N13_100073 [Hibiscus sabdariffa]